VNGRCGDEPRSAAPQDECGARVFISDSLRTRGFETCTFTALVGQKIEGRPRTATSFTYPEVPSAFNFLNPLVQKTVLSRSITLMRDKLPIASPFVLVTVDAKKKRNLKPQFRGGVGCGTSLSFTTVVSFFQEF